MGAKHSCTCCGRTNKQNTGCKSNDVCVSPEEQQQIVQAAKEWKLEKKEMPPEPTPEPEDYERVEADQTAQNFGDATNRPETNIPEKAPEPKQSFQEPATAPENREVHAPEASPRTASEETKTPDKANTSSVEAKTPTMSPKKDAEQDVQEPATAPENREVHAPDALPRTASEETKTPEVTPRTASTALEEAKTPAMSPRMDDEQDVQEPATAPENRDVHAPDASPRTASEETKTPEATPKTAITSLEEAKTPAMSPRMDDEQDVQAKITWKVVGGAENGLVVRENEGLKSKQLGRLSCGAIVEEINRTGIRLRYQSYLYGCKHIILAGISNWIFLCTLQFGCKACLQKLTGDGPTSGWITTIVNGKQMLSSFSDSSTV